jgi:hypothetical protein
MDRLAVARASLGALPETVVDWPRGPSRSAAKRGARRRDRGRGLWCRLHQHVVVGGATQWRVLVVVRVVQRWGAVTLAQPLSPSTEDTTPGERLRVGGRGRRGVARGWRWRSIRRWSGRRWQPTRGWSALRQLARWRPTRGRRRWPVLANRPYLGFRAPWVGWEGRRGEAREGDTGMPAGGLEMHRGRAAASGGPGRGLATCWGLPEKFE